MTRHYLEGQGSSLHCIPSFCCPACSLISVNFCLNRNHNLYPKWLAIHKTEGSGQTYWPALPISRKSRRQNKQLLPSLFILSASSSSPPPLPPPPPPLFLLLLLLFSCAFYLLSGAHTFNDLVSFVLSCSSLNALPVLFIWISDALFHRFAGLPLSILPVGCSGTTS